MRLIEQFLLDYLLYVIKNGIYNIMKIWKINILKTI